MKRRLHHRTYRTPLDVKIETATPADAKAIASVHVAVWEATYKGLIPDDLLKGHSLEQREWLWGKVLAQSPARNIVLVVREDAEEVAGFGCLSALRDGPASYKGEFQSIYLLPQFQHQGWGRKLLSRMAEGLARQKLLPALAWVLKANANACRFYEAMGGQIAAERPLAGNLHEIAYGWETVPTAKE